MNANNIFIIKGNLTKKPTLIQNDKGNSYCYLNLAVDNGYDKSGNPDYLTVVVWGKPAENATKYLVKGQNVSIAGTISSFIDKEKKIQLRLTAQDVQYGRKPQLTKEKETVAADPTNSDIPNPIEPPEEFFNEENEDMDV